MCLKDYSDCLVENILLEDRDESRENVWETSAIIQRGDSDLENDGGSEVGEKWLKSWCTLKTESLKFPDNLDVGCKGTIEFMNMSVD